MKKIHLLALVVLAFSCAEKDDNGCSSDLSNLSNLQLQRSSLFTGEIIELNPRVVCYNDRFVMLINGEEVEGTKNELGVYTFVLPSISGPTATVTLRAGKEEVSLGTYPVVKAAGSWKEVASFPGERYANMHDFATSTHGYLFGGIDFDGSYHADLYKYDVAGNSWTKVLTNDAFQSNSEAFNGNKLFLPGKTFSIADNSFSSISGIKYRGEGVYWTTQYFTCLGITYAISDINQQIIEIQKYDASGNTWSVVQAFTYLDPEDQDYFEFNFAVEYNGATYIGINALNSQVTYLYKFNGSTQEFTKVGSVSTNISGSTRSLVHAFTINNLGYFVERGEASSDFDGKVDIIEPGNHFYVFNFTTSEWHQVFADFPESMFGFSSLNVSNRGFMGISVSAGATTGFVFSTRFYEFVPAQ